MLCYYRDNIMTIMVTGGAGYIGSHAAKELSSLNKDFIIYDNLSKGHREAVNNFTLIEGDIRDKEKLTEVIKDYNINSVIHFAADSLVGESMSDPAKYYSNNVYGSLNLFNTMIENNVKKIVFSSTAAVYGDCAKIKITEDTPQNPTSVYGKTKIMIEQILEDYDRAYALKYISLRYFNVAGAYYNSEIGEDHTPESHLIPIIMKVLLGKIEKLNIYGTDYDTEDGTCIRDYIHVTDLSRAHLLALDSLDRGADSNIYNLGNGNGFSVKEVIKTVEAVTGQKVNKKESSRRAGDPSRLVASSEKIIRELNWKPEFNDLRAIIKSAWKWHKNNPEGYK